MRHLKIACTLFLGAASFALSGCASQPQSMEEFERIYERARKRSDAALRKQQRALEKAQARDAARQQ